MCCSKNLSLVEIVFDTISRLHQSGASCKFFRTSVVVDALIDVRATVSNKIQGRHFA